MSAPPTASALIAPTIFALATPAGRGAVAVVRLSGAMAGASLARLCGGRMPHPRQAALRRLRTAEGEVVDEALVLWMPGPASFTGEDCVELHLHGGRAVVAGVSDLLVAAGLRLAEPGEFTRRAFEHGRLDLSQAEAISDLVEAESGAQRRQALAQLGGALARRYDTWRGTLLDSLAMLEAEIDFPDEDVPEATGALAALEIGRLLSDMAAAVFDMRGERVREGFRIALIGAPNVGKSSLLNALAGREAAIVTPIAGTTRDVVEAPFGLGGQTIVLADTAGLRETDEIIEAEGVRRAQAWAASADLRIGVVDCTRPETVGAVIDQLVEGDVIALNKFDLSSAGARAPAETKFETIPTTASSTGVNALRIRLESWLTDQGDGREFPAVTRGRHRALLQDALAHLERALTDLRIGPELSAENVRLALRALERVTGRSDPEAVLDRVFSSFCIGK